MAQKMSTTIRQTSIAPVVPITGNDSALCDVQAVSDRQPLVPLVSGRASAIPQFVDLASMSDSDAGAMLDLLIERAAVGGPFVVVVRMSPATARLVHKRSPGNCRRESNVHVNTLTRDMNAGHFRLTGDTLKFTASGVFVDGHHRMIALSRSVPAARVDFAVFFGMEDEAKDNIDQGNIRSAAAVLGKKSKNVSAIRAALTLLSSGTSKTSKWSIGEIRDGSARWHTALESVGPINAHPAPVWGTLITLHSSHPQKVADFAAQLRAGALDGCHSSVRTLWNELQKVDAAGWENGFRVAILTMYAVKAFVLDRPLTKFSPPKDLRETRTPNGIFTWFRAEAGAPLNAKQVLDPTKLAETIAAEREARESARRALVAG